MIKKREDGTVCMALLESAERQSSNACVGSSPVRAEESSLALLRRTLDQLPPAASWEQIRSQILASFSGLPDEPQLGPAPAGSGPVPGDAGGPGMQATASGQEPCLVPKSPTPVPPSASPRPLLSQPFRRIMWSLPAAVLVIAILLLGYHPNARQSPPRVVLPAQQNSAPPLASPESPPAQPRAVVSVAARPAVLTAVQPEFTPASTRVLIALTAPVDYEVHRLAKPERVYIDFRNVRLALPSKAGNFIVGKPCLLKYRLAARAPRTVRIAFETGTACDYSARLTIAPSPSLLLLLRPAPSTTAP